MQEEDLVGDLAEPHHRPGTQHACVPAAGVAHQRCQQAHGHHRVEDRLEHPLPWFDIRGGDITGDRQRHHQQRGHRDRQRDGGAASDVEFAQHDQAHPADEVDEMRRQPDGRRRRQHVGDLRQQQPQRCHRAERGQRCQQPTRSPRSAAQHRQQQSGQQRQHRIEGDFDCQTPHLGQTLVHFGVVQRRIDLGQGEMLQQSQPAMAGIRSGVAELVDREGGQHRDDVGRRDAAYPATGVAAHRRRRGSLGRGHDPGPEQQVTRQDEEHRDADFQPRVELTEIAVIEMAGSEGRMGGDDEQRRHRAQPGQRRHPIRRGAIGRRRTAGRTRHLHRRRAAADSPAGVMMRAAPRTTGPAHRDVGPRCAVPRPSC